MTIQEAIKSGKRYRRKGREHWVGPYDASEAIYGRYAFLDVDILADDWEVESVKKELSAENIRLAIGFLDEAGYLPKLSCLEINRFEKMLLIQLGLS